MPLSLNQIVDVFSLNDKLIPETILTLNVHNENSEKIIVSHINKLLSSAKTRQSGLEYLNCLLPNYSPRIFSENGSNWLQHAAIQTQYPDNLKELKLNVVSNIVKNTYTDQDFTKKFVSEHLSKVMDTCLNTKTDINEIHAALDCLTTCIQLYSSSVTSFKQRIETFLSHFLDNSSESLVDTAALAFHISQQIGNAGAGGINHTNNFSSEFSKLCNTVHTLYDGFFENVTEIDTVERNQDGDVFKFEIPTSSDSIQMLQITAMRLRNCLCYIEVMLSKSFSSFKSIKFKLLLSVVQRGMNVHNCLSQENLPLQSYYFSIFLQQIQIDLLKILQIAIIWLRSNILPFSYTVSKILIDSLKRCHNCDCFKADSLYQESIYKTLGSLLRVIKTGVSLQFQTQLLECVCKDITPAKNKVTLTITNVDKTKSNKAKQKAINDRIMGVNQDFSTRQTEHTKLSHHNSCKLALTVLKQLFYSSGLSVNNKTLLNLYNTVMNVINVVQQGKCPTLYEDPECQILLYEVLVSFYEQDCTKILPPPSKALLLLHKAIRGEGMKVVAVCEDGISRLEKLCQPICPSMSIEQNFGFISEEFQNVLPQKTVNILDVQYLQPPTQQEEEVAVNNGHLVDESQILNGTAEDVIEIDEHNVEDVDKIVASDEDIEISDDSRDTTKNNEEIDNIEASIEDSNEELISDEPLEKRIKIAGQQINHELALSTVLLIEDDCGFVDEVKDD